MKFYESDEQDSIFFFLSNLFHFFSKVPAVVLSNISIRNKTSHFKINFQSHCPVTGALITLASILVGLCPDQDSFMRLTGLSTQ